MSWREATELDYPDKAVLNPSYGAAVAMIVRHWGQSDTLLRRWETAMPESGGWASVEEGKARNVRRLKRFIDQGLPVIVFPTLTPVAHPSNPILESLARQGQLELPPTGPTSGVLGRMAPLEEFPEVARLLGDYLGMSAWESLLVSARVVIGYDDTRKAVIVHDPSFGPAREVSYEDFDRMWQPLGRGFVVVRPRDARAAAGNGADTAYARPTADENAAWRYVLGYALAAAGRVQDAWDEYAAALRVPGLGKGYRHLLLLESAVLLHAQRRTEEAIAAAEEAIALLPEHAAPWVFLAAVYKDSSAPDAEQKRFQAELRVQALCDDDRAKKTVEETLRLNLFIFGCAGLHVRTRPG